MKVKEILRVGVILFLITAVAAALLAVINSVTAPIIVKNSEIKEQSSMREVMPEADEFIEVELFNKPSEVDKTYRAVDKDKNTVGACIITVTSGYDTGIKAVTGVSENLTVEGVKIISMNETPGLGANAKNAEFLEMYKGKTEGIGVSKKGESDTQIQAISGATLTSEGVTNGVNIALDIAKEIIGGDRND